MNAEAITGAPTSGFRWSWHDRVARAVKRGHTLLVSEHGIGKTFSARVIAASSERPLWYVSASHGLDRAVLEGHYQPAPAGAPIFVQDPEGGYHMSDPHIMLQSWDGIVTSAVAGDGYLMIDEFFRLPGDVASTLFAAMDTHRGEYSIAYRGATVHVGENFRVIACTNPPSPLYPEVETSDRALLSRFTSVIRLPFPSKEDLARFLAHTKFPRDHVVQTVHFVTKVYDAYRKGELDNFVSPRDLIGFRDALADTQAAGGAGGYAVEDALVDSVVGKFSERYHEALSGFWRMGAKA